MAAITELHYSDAYSNASGVAEFIEITLEPGENPADFTLSMVNANSSVFLDVPLTDSRFTASLPDPVTGRTTYLIQDNVPSGFNFRLTDPTSGSNTVYEAFALVNTSGPSNTLISFWDIGGGDTAITPNPASAVGQISPTPTSQNIPVPTGPNAATYSIQFSPDNPNLPLTLPVTPAAPPCFTPGTLIHTPKGLRSIETLQIGDTVLTEGHGESGIRWIGRRTFSRAQLMANSKLFPVRVTAGSLGQNYPKRDLLLSRQHRLAISSPIVKRMFGEESALVSAAQLTKLSGIYVDTRVGRVEYLHILLDQHSLIWAEGALAESLYLGSDILHTMTEDAWAEITEIFPTLHVKNRPLPTPARLIPTRQRQHQLIKRHIKNKKTNFIPSP